MSTINANSAAAARFVPVADNIAKPATADPLRVTQAETAKAVTPVTDVSQAELQQAVDVVNQAVALEQRSLSFSIDDTSGRSVIKVVDFATDELIKQIPTEELLKVAQDIKRLQDEMGQSIGLLIDKKV